MSDEPTDILSDDIDYAVRCLKAWSKRVQQLKALQKNVSELKELRERVQYLEADLTKANEWIAPRMVKEFQVVDRNLGLKPLSSYEVPPLPNRGLWKRLLNPPGAD